MAILALLPWVFPFIVAATLPLVAKIGGRARDWYAVSGGLVSGLSSLLIGIDSFDGVLDYLGGVKMPYDLILAEWIPIDGYRVTFGVLLDSLSIFMANVVALIGTLILIYSVEYMHGDEGILRYWMLMNIFIGSMQVLVLGDSLLAMFFGWEGVGFASYGLIGYYYRDEKEYWIGPYPPTHAGMKAFITTRIGDVGLLVATIVIFLTSGTMNFLDLASEPGWAAELARSGVLAATLLLALLGPIGKSAQFPLHEWLPEAMAGPTPVSALIHAATMVKAGVYFLARFTGILYEVYWALEEVGVNIWGELSLFYTAVAFVGAFTAFLAASQGMVSDQIKKVLAYSTVSQLGYMFAAFGMAGLLIEHPKAFADVYATGIYHLSSHAIFKALLFLSAGVVGHAVHSYLFRDMGGLRRYMPFTYSVMMIGSLALAGVPPFNGFWSKDAILHAAYVEGFGYVYLVLAVSAILTGFYTFRMMGLAFHGEESEHVRHMVEEGHPPHDPGILMKAPLAILAAATVVSGFLLPMLGSYFKPLFKFMGVPEEELLAIKIFKSPDFFISTVTSPLFLVAMGLVALGVVPSYMVYLAGRYDPEKLVTGPLKPIWSFLYNRWYINAFYYKVFVDGVYALSRGIYNYFEVTGGGEAFKQLYISLSEAARRVQTGYLRMNMSYMLLALVLMTILYMVVV